MNKQEINGLQQLIKHQTSNAYTHKQKENHMNTHTNKEKRKEEKRREKKRGDIRRKYKRQRHMFR